MCLVVTLGGAARVRRLVVRLVVTRAAAGAGGLSVLRRRIAVARGCRDLHRGRVTGRQSAGACAGGSIVRVAVGPGAHLNKRPVTVNGPVMDVG